jgi:hypothetical protein
MAVETIVEPDVARRQLKMFFEQTRPVSQLLATLRSRRLGRAQQVVDELPKTSTEKVQTRFLVQALDPSAPYVFSRQQVSA